MQKLLLLTIFASLFLGRIESAEMDEIKQKTLSYVSAYNKQDAKAMAQHWAQNATYQNPFTKATVQGRSEIEKQFSENFKELGNVNLNIEITSVDFPEKSKAIEKGKATITRPGLKPQETLFQVTLVKENGQWYFSKIDEISWLETPKHYEHLKDLEWLIGEWVDTSEVFDVTSKYEWDKYKNFITHHFTVKAFGNFDLEGKQIIGWNPVKKEVYSWMFDSDGGFAEGKWKKKGNVWIVETASTLPNGDIGSQVSLITPVDKNSYTLEITGREVEGESLPDLTPVKIVRKGGS